MGESQIQRRKVEAFFEEKDGAPLGPPTEEKIGNADDQEKGAQRTDVNGIDTHIRRKIEIGKKQGAAGKPESADPECNRQHENEAYDVYRMETPCAVKTVPNGGSAKEGPEVIAYGASGKGNETDAPKRKPTSDGANGQPIIADEDNIVDDHKESRKGEFAWRNVENGLPDFLEAVAFQLMPKKPAGKDENAEYKDFS